MRYLRGGVYVTQAEVTWDGITVWVNSAEASIGRFGRMGIDVHTADGSGCLHCTHAPTDNPWAWGQFVADMLTFHGVVIPAEAMPIRCAAPTVREIDGCLGGGSCQH